MEGVKNRSKRKAVVANAKLTRADPTRTLSIRRAMSHRLRLAFAQLKGKLVTYLPTLNSADQPRDERGRFTKGEAAEEGFLYHGMSESTHKEFMASKGFEQGGFSDTPQKLYGPRYIAIRERDMPTPDYKQGRTNVQISTKEGFKGAVPLRSEADVRYYGNQVYALPHHHFYEADEHGNILGRLKGPTSNSNPNHDELGRFASGYGGPFKRKVNGQIAFTPKQKREYATLTGEARDRYIGIVPASPVVPASPTTEFAKMLEPLGIREVPKASVDAAPDHALWHDEVTSILAAADKRLPMDMKALKDSAAPHVPLEEFRAGLLKMREQGRLRLHPYTRSYASMPDPGHSIAEPAGERFGEVLKYLTTNFDPDQPRGPDGRWGFGSALRAARDIKDRFAAQLDRVTDVPMLRSVKAGLARAKGIQERLTASLRDRYGSAATVAILASGQAMGWGAVGVGLATTGIPVVLPGASLWGAIPGVVLAEGVLQATRLWRKAKAALVGNAEISLTSVQVRDAAIQYLRDFAEEWSDYTSFTWNFDPDQPRDEHGKFSVAAHMAARKAEAVAARYGEHGKDWEGVSVHFPGVAVPVFHTTKAAIQVMEEGFQAGKGSVFGGTAGGNVHSVSMTSNLDWSTKGQGAAFGRYTFVMDEKDLEKHGNISDHQDPSVDYEFERRFNGGSIPPSEIRGLVVSKHMGKLEKEEASEWPFPVVYNDSKLGWTKVPRKHTSNLLTNDAPSAPAWAGSSSRERLEGFQEWLRQQLGELAVGKTQEQLWKEYIHQGFKKGAGRAFDDLNRARPKFTPEQQTFYAGSRDQFLRSSFAQPVARERVELLAARTFDEMKNVVGDMANRMSRTLADGMVQGKGADEVARDLAEVVDLGRSRAEVVARTELIRAHAEGQLTALEQLGVTEVGVEVEWQATADGITCPLCSDLEGTVLSIEDARGMLPRHPNCRCCWVPSVPEPEGE